MEPIHVDWFQLLTVLGTAVVTAAGAVWYGIKCVAVWLKPWIERLLNSWVIFIDKLTSQHVVLEQFAASLSVLTQIVSTQQVIISRGQNIVLVVDDSPIDRKLIGTALFAVLAENENWKQLRYVEVDKLYLAYDHQPFCRLVILDKGLPDATPEQVLAFLNYSKHCKVIIYTGDEDNEGCEKAYTVIQKGTDSISVLKDKIREALQA